jgi:DNA-directed RNA polymerase subunit RPC12/RpoP
MKEHRFDNMMAQFICMECGQCAWEVPPDEENPDPTCGYCGLMASKSGRWIPRQPGEPE